MKLTTQILRSLKKDMEREIAAIGNAVRTGTKEATDGLKLSLRQQVSGAGLGTKLANSWRGKMFENDGANPAGFVYTKAPQIIQAFDRGALIKPAKSGGIWLAIPTESAPKRGTDGKRVTPLNFPESRLGKLVFVYRSRGPSFLVVHNVRASYSRKTGQMRGFRKASDAALRSGKGLTTAIMFILIRQVKLSKKLNVEGATRIWIDRMPELIEKQYTRRMSGDAEP